MTSIDRVPTILAEGRALVGGTLALSLPGVETTATTTQTLAAQTVRYAPIVVATPITVDQLVIEVTAAGTAGQTARVGLYRADRSWQPTGLVVDGGTVAVDTIGVKIASVSVTLAAGRYLTAINSDGTPTVRAARGGARYVGFLPTLGGAPVIVNLTATQTYTAFPATGTAITGTGGGGSGVTQCVWLRVSGP